MIEHWEINKQIEYQLKEPKTHTWGLNVVAPIP
jgi:hypothetical protein